MVAFGLGRNSDLKIIALFDSGSSSDLCLLFRFFMLHFAFDSFTSCYSLLEFRYFMLHLLCISCNSLLCKVLPCFTLLLSKYFMQPFAFGSGRRVSFKL